MDRRTFLAGLFGTISAAAAGSLKLLSKAGVPAWVLPGANLDVDFVNNRMWHKGMESTIDVVSLTSDAQTAAQLTKSIGTWYFDLPPGPPITEMRCPYTGKILWRAGDKPLPTDNVIRLTAPTSAPDPTSA